MTILQPKVSVIMPVYNAEKYVDKAIRSVLEQEYKNIELIIVDDASTDSSRDIIQSYCNEYPEIAFLTNHNKKGPSGARNTAIEIATGEYLTFLDSDDNWYTHHISEGVKYLNDHNNVDSLLFNFNIYDVKSDKITNDWFQFKDIFNRLNLIKMKNNLFIIDDDLFDILLQDSIIHLQSLILRKSKIKGIAFNENIIYSEDRDFAIRVYLEGKAVYGLVDIITCQYNRHETNLTTFGVENEIKSCSDQIFLFKSYLEKYDLDQKKRQIINNNLCDLNLKLNYSHRLKKEYLLAFMRICSSMKYKLSYKQLKEISKLFASMF